MLLINTLNYSTHKMNVRNPIREINNHRSFSVAPFANTSKKNHAPFMQLVRFTSALYTTCNGQKRQMWFPCARKKSRIQMFRSTAGEFVEIPKYINNSLHVCANCQIIMWFIMCVCMFFFLLPLPCVDMHVAVRNKRYELSNTKSVNPNAIAKSLATMYPAYNDFADVI